MQYCITTQGTHWKQERQHSWTAASVEDEAAWLIPVQKRQPHAVLSWCLHQTHQTPRFPASVWRRTPSGGRDLVRPSNSTDAAPTTTKPYTELITPKYNYSIVWPKTSWVGMICRTHQHYHHQWLPNSDWARDRWLRREWLWENEVFY